MEQRFEGSDTAPWHVLVFIEVKLAPDPVFWLLRHVSAEEVLGLEECHRDAVSTEVLATVVWIGPFANNLEVRLLFAFMDAVDNALVCISEVIVVRESHSVILVFCILCVEISDKLDVPSRVHGRSNAFHVKRSVPVAEDV